MYKDEIGVCVLLSHKESKTMVFIATMDRPRDYPIKWSLAEKDKYHMVSLMWNLEKHDTNELIYKTKIDSQTRKTNLRLSKGEGEG